MIGVRDKKLVASTFIVELVNMTNANDKKGLLQLERNGTIFISSQLLESSVESLFDAAKRAFHRRILKKINQGFRYKNLDTTVLERSIYTDNFGMAVKLCIKVKAVDKVL